MGRTRPPYSRPYTTPSSSATLATPSTPKPTSTGILPLPPISKPSVPITRLSPEALQKQRADGLCFRCPEKYTPGNKCTQPQFMLVVDNDETNIETTDITTASTDVNHNNLNHQFFSLSTTAFFGLSSPQALRLTGFIKNHPVTKLIDYGSPITLFNPGSLRSFNLISNQSRNSLLWLEMVTTSNAMAFAQTWSSRWITRSSPFRFLFFLWKGPSSY